MALASMRTPPSSSVEADLQYLPQLRLRARRLGLLELRPLGRHRPSDRLDSFTIVKAGNARYSVAGTSW
jgi:hypothetical protein